MFRIVPRGAFGLSWRTCSSGALQIELTALCLVDRLREHGLQPRIGAAARGTGFRPAI
ncbi:MAG: hypothetical protein ACMVO3_25165 [Thalassobaculum sp.]